MKQYRQVWRFPYTVAPNPIGLLYPEGSVERALRSEMDEQRAELERAIFAPDPFRIILTDWPGRA